MIKKNNILLIISILIVSIILIFCKFNYFNKNKDKIITLATTTDIKDSGILDMLIENFKKDTNIKVNVLASNNIQALKIAEKGEADVLLVHSKLKEQKFIKDGFGTKRKKIMYNDFILVGPKNDPLNIKIKAPNDIKKAFEIINKNKTIKFISRNDGSSVDFKEKTIWDLINIIPDKKYYISTGKGMSSVLKIAFDMQAYTFTDRATYVALKKQKQIDLIIITEKGKNLYNQYSIIILNYNKLNIKKYNRKAAEKWIKWMFSKKALNLINKFGIKEYGESLFVAN